MPSIKKCTTLLICLVAAFACLLGLFTVMDSSSVRAKQDEVSPPSIPQPEAFIISPTGLSASQYPDSVSTQTLWLTNTGDSLITYTIYEMTDTLGLNLTDRHPFSVPRVDSDAQAHITSRGEAQVIIFLRGQPDLTPASRLPDRVARKRVVYNHLVELASHSSQLFAWLESQGTHPQRLITANAISARINTAQVKILAGHPQVMRIGINHQVQAIATAPATNFLPANLSKTGNQPATVEWNISRIRADEVWETFGIRGQGTVVGIVDTGVMYTHPALVSSYRGNLGGGIFDHNHNWYDFVTGQPVPFDPVGHGTMAAGIVSGDDGAGKQIGVAPNAKWIAVRACGTGCTEADLLAALEWMLAPYDLNGQNPDPSKAPDVVLGMWGGPGCDNTFQPSLSALRAAGILPVFSPGGSGPGCGTVGSPADLPEVLAAGATDDTDTIASFSSRGPVLCNPGLVKPDLAAPGINILTSYIAPDYITTSGTSWSAAHTAGAAALVLSADHDLGPDALQGTLFSTALCIDDDQCNAGPCPEPNPVYGHGLIDVFEAVSVTIGTLPPDNLPWLSETPISGTLAAGQGAAVEVTFDSSSLVEGNYTGALGIATSDPITPFISLPVTLNILSQPVGPILRIEPLSFSVTLPATGRQTETLSIANDGDSLLTFTLYEVTASLRLLTTPLDLSFVDTSLAPSNEPARVDASVRTQLLSLGKARLILFLRGQPNLSFAYTIPNRVERVQYVYDQLLKSASQSNALFEWLKSQGADPHRLLTANAIAATLNAHQLNGVLGFDQVRRVSINGHAEILQDESTARNWQDSLSSLPSTIEWNIAKIRADEAWETFNIRGQGAVVGIVDTGVMYDHPALISQYRGNLGDENFDHNYNWFDLINDQPVPYDDHSHGTFGAGIAVGDDGGVNQIGVAPNAQWVAVKAFSGTGNTSEEILHAALEWMLAPTDLSGANPSPKLAPHLILNMWFWAACDKSFESDLEILHAANILPVFAPEMLDYCNISPPAASPFALSAGSTDANDEISPFSSYGPSCFDPAMIKPDLAAPGVNIRSSANDGSYQVWSGTSFSTAHLAGAAALLFSADSRISIDELMQALFTTAICHDEDLSCGGGQCPAANNTSGFGRIDVFEAVSLTMQTNPPFDLPWLEIGPLAGELPPGQQVNFGVVFDASVVPPGEYHGGIGIESNDPSAPFTFLPVHLTVEQVANLRYLLPVILR